MNEYCKEILVRMYEKCLDEIDKKHDESLLTSMISKRSNTIKRAFINAAFESTTSNAINSLKEEGYVKEIAPGKYILSGRGIFYVEFELKSLGVDYYIDWVDSEFLQMGNEPISDKNKVILLSLFSVRCFSEQTCATYSDSNKEKAFLNSLVDCEQFLLSTKLIKQSVLESNNSKSKSRISTILGQIDKLPSSTGMKFIAKDKHYYLDILKNGGIDRPAVTFITTRV